jgi:hypothetical protein
MHCMKNWIYSRTSLRNMKSINYSVPYILSQSFKVQYILCKVSIYELKCVKNKSIDEKFRRSCLDRNSGKIHKHFLYWCKIVLNCITWCFNPFNLRINILQLLLPLFVRRLFSILSGNMEWLQSNGLRWLSRLRTFLVWVEQHSK